MEISRRSLLKTASASGLVAAGLAVSEGLMIVQP
ncbi:MAG: twin-arginine translocation signal domain-containing protein [Nostoc sp.]